jgi:hypothetical protein
MATGSRLGLGPLRWGGVFQRHWLALVLLGARLARGLGWRRLFLDGGELERVAAVLLGLAMQEQVGQQKQLRHGLQTQWS